jgi:hypothetical protein
MPHAATLMLGIPSSSSQVNADLTQIHRRFIALRFIGGWMLATD